MLRLKTELQPKTNTEISPEPRPTSSLASSLASSVAKEKTSRPTSAVRRLREVDFHSSQNWWSLLVALSTEAGFSVTKLEERCEREEGGRTLVQTLVQCTTEPVLGNHHQSSANNP